jgi:hypothetical protein
MKIVALSSAALVVSLSVIGCAAKAEEEEATSTATSALQAQSQAGVTDAVVDIDGEEAPEPEDAAQKVVDQDVRGFRPAGCATKSREGAVVTVKLAGCTGPFGKVVLDGSLVATFSKSSSNVLHVDIAASDDTTANGKALAYAAQADVRYDGAQRFLTYSGQSSGETKRGKTFARHTDLSIVADVSSHCAKIDGVSKGSIGKYEIDLTVEGLDGCRDQCPRAGKVSATVDGPALKGAAVSVVFDGSPNAHVSTKHKGDFDVALDCDAAEAE